MPFVFCRRIPPLRRSRCSHWPWALGQHCYFQRCEWRSVALITVPRADRLISIDGGQSRPDLEDFSRQSRSIAQLGGFAEWSFDAVHPEDPSRY